MPAKERAEAGLHFLNGGSVKVDRDWEVKTLPTGQKKVDGCNAIERFPYRIVGSADLSDCEKSLPISYQLTLQNGQFQCWSVTKSDALISHQKDIEQCLSTKTDQIQFFLTNPTSPKCGAYSRSFEFIQQVDQKYCKREYVVFDPDDRKPYPYEEFPGFESLSKKELLEKAKLFGSLPYVCLSVDQALDRVCARDTVDDDKCKGINDRYAFVTESCLIGAKNELVSEVTSLKVDETIPSSVYEQYSPNRIATSLIYRYFQMNERPKMKPEDVVNASYPLYTNQYPMMAFNLKNLPSILKYGFKNLHQTGAGNGSSSTTARARTEDWLMSLHFEQSLSTNRESIVHHVRPKYSFAMFSKYQSDLTPSTVSQYGEYLALFKSRVKRRMTVSVGDTLDNRGTAGFIVKTMYSTTSGAFKFNRTSRYYENQIYGDLTVDDIDGLLVNCPGHAGRASELIRTLTAEKSDLPVYECDNASHDGFASFKKGKLIYGTDVSP